MEQKIEKIISIANRITNKIPQEFRNKIFWSPKKHHVDGMVDKLYLYAFGGFVLSIYIEEENIKYCCNFYKYKEKYFGNLWTAEFDKRLLENKIGRNCSNIDALIGLSEEDLRIILKAYENRMYGKSESNTKCYLERGRETIIASTLESKFIRDKDVHGFRIVELESDIPTVSKKPDLLGIRKENDTWIISFIEYKSTKNGMGVSLEDHFIDMIRYYNDKNFDQSYYYQTLYEQVLDYVRVKCKLINCDFDYKPGDKVCGEIVFLFSHIGDKDGITSQLVYNNTKRMHNSELYTKQHEEYVKFAILKDENMGLDVKDYWDTNSLLELPIFKNCKKNQWCSRRKEK